MDFLLIDAFEEDNEREREPRIFRPRVDPFVEYRDVEFVKRYRLPKEAVRMLADRMVQLNLVGPLHGVGTAISAGLTVSTYHIVICSTIPRIHFLNIKQSEACLIYFINFVDTCETNIMLLQNNLPVCNRLVISW